MTNHVSINLESIEGNQTFAHRYSHWSLEGEVGLGRGEGVLTYLAEVVGMLMIVCLVSHSQVLVPSSQVLDWVLGLLAAACHDLCGDCVP